MSSCSAPTDGSASGGSRPVSPIRPTRNPARKGSPLAAASRIPLALDLVYVDRDHRLVRQFSQQGPAVDWTNNVQTVPPPARAGSREALLVAGSSNLAVLPSANDAVHNADRLDVFHVGHDYLLPPWNNPRAWQVVHTRWVFTCGRATALATTLVPGLDGVAAASGVAAVRTADQTLHTIAQDRARTRLKYATLKRTASDWETAQGPTGELPLPHRPERGDPLTAWWMNLQLVATVNRVLLVGVLATGHLGWSTYNGTAWSDIAAKLAGFTPGRPLCLARRGAKLVDVFGFDEDGRLLRRTLTLLDKGGCGAGSLLETLLTFPSCREVGPALTGSATSWIPPRTSPVRPARPPGSGVRAAALGRTLRKSIAL
ncbi:hypothetical protein [Streptomyces sp. BPTC-684]|uniref:hypothetical protein n=1 Tax=Streptomyces sp. BPTC-684 TaxID=3043734 RepID=UPI0024B268DA|nr:hypothetical protein [Streptomyces sp. BPTC-684]WHM40983.1 hypothetical protein QIY60_31685 [Streptomyces sp. BPTC-684]